MAELPMLEGLNIIGIEAGPPVSWSAPGPWASWLVKGVAPGLNITGGAPRPGAAAGATGGAPLGTIPGSLVTGLLIPDWPSTST